MYESTSTGQIIIQVQKAIIESPRVNILNQPWFIALLGSLISIVIVLIIDAIRGKIKKNKILHGLFREISLITESQKQNLPVLKEILEDFQQGKRIGVPHADENYGENYHIYLSNFILLDIKLDADIYLFYNYSKLINSISKLFSEFSDRFRTSDPNIKQADIIAILSDIINKKEKSFSLGNSILERLKRHLF